MNCDCYLRKASQFLLKEQVAAVIKRTFAQIHLVRQLYPILDWKALQSFHTAGHLMNGLFQGVLWVWGLPLKITWKLQLVQKIAVKAAMVTNSQ